MALIITDSTICSICNQTLKHKDSIISWTAFLPQKHHLWKFSDSGMHKNCFEEWEYKSEFIYLSKYQPHLDFESEDIKEMIKKHGYPNWLKQIKKFRQDNPKFIP
ncbi:hypothetical protein [Tenacibaculum amylolyticum]|uniref:hypothetical protein n=1 Tax=Tenacibaculum amylolyticum TaxID=104269 RepID=UPI0038964E17